MPSQNDKRDKTPASTSAGALEAPLTLAADQLELVAGGVAAVRVGPTNGLIRALQ